jgi:hypothetical protein
MENIFDNVKGRPWLVVDEIAGGEGAAESLVERSMSAPQAD